MTKYAQFNINNREKMVTKQIINISNSQKMESIGNESVDLVVTSPPYPMIEMWDEIFLLQNSSISSCIEEKPDEAFELMHQELDKVWEECYRVIKPGGFMCVNIGDATRTINGNFKLYNNHTRILETCNKLGFISLPNIIWRKQTNAPNKFMGSGMLPCGAYVTLEHEWILIFRKGDKRKYKTSEEKLDRMKSSFFWEERNIWFSDVWDIKGTKQKIQKNGARERSAAYPFEIPFRLINMFSQKNDVVLDPFLGMGTTMKAAILCERNSIGYEIDPTLDSIIRQGIDDMDIDFCNSLIKQRYDRHVNFIEERKSQGKEIKHFNKTLNVPVMTTQEEKITFNYLLSIYSDSKNVYHVDYEPTSDMKLIPSKLYRKIL